MRIMGIFKAYDIRGIYPTELDEEIAYKIARAFVSHLKVTEVVVAMDCRPSSVGLKKSIIKGITDQGADVVDIGLSTTPMYYWAIANYKRQSGIMITASHNPKEYNGLKLCKEMAINLHAKLGMPEIKELFEKGEFVDPEKKGTVRKQDALNEYHAFIIKLIGEKLPFKVAVDCANGMSSLDLPVFKKLNCEVDAIFSELDGTFPNHEADPLKPANTTELQEKIKSGYDLGIAFDGDSDRVVFIDENGQRAQTDLIVAVLALKILEQHPGANIVHDLRTSWIVADVIKEHGGKPLINRVGHSFLKHRMRDEDAAFAGELSGHLFYKDIFYTDNALYSALLVLSVMKETGKKLSELLKPLQVYFASGEINFKVKDKDAKIAELKKEFSDGKLLEIDGITVSYDDWWFNVRPSNTEEVVRLTLEAKTKEKKEEMVERITGMLSS